MDTRENAYPEFDVNVHPSVEEIAAYLSGRMSPEAIEKVDAHLGSCRDCRHEVVSARAIRSDEVRRPRRWLIPALAAAVGLVAITLRSVTDNDPERVSTRTTGDGRASIAVISPISEAGIAGVQFIWNDVGDKPLYQITLSDSSGGEVWETTTPDTTIALPHSVTLRVGERYLWYVDASTQGGLTATSGVQSFRTAK